MKQLSRDDSRRFGELQEEISFAVDALNTAREVYEARADEIVAALAAHGSVVIANTALVEVWAPVAAAWCALGFTWDNARLFREQLVDEMTSYWDERSEKWQEGPRGEAFASWKDAWENALSDEIEAPDAPAIDADDAEGFDPSAPELDVDTDEFAGLPTEMEV